MKWGARFHVCHHIAWMTPLGQTWFISKITYIQKLVLPWKEVETTLPVSLEIIGPLCWSFQPSQLAAIPVYNIDGTIWWRPRWLHRKNTSLDVGINKIEFQPGKGIFWASTYKKFLLRPFRSYVLLKEQAQWNAIRACKRLSRRKVNRNKNHTSNFSPLHNMSFMVLAV